MNVKRRRFIQLAGATLSIASVGNRSLGQPVQPGRRLALLVGINDYPAGSQIPSLRGCLTDVELQKNLLIYRYGFAPTDIVTLTNVQATRHKILEAFEKHLIRQAQPEDVVVFHYSGHGSQVADRDRDFADGLVSTLVPVDSDRMATQGPVMDLTGHTLFLLMSALATDKVTVILDCCYSGGGKRGNCQVRAIAGGPQYEASPAELAYQQRWLSQLGWSVLEFKRRRRQGVAKGVVITATDRDQLAADMAFDGFAAGAFTYLMTQSLWQQERNPAAGQWLPAIAYLTQQLSFTRQRPELEVRPASQNEQRPVYFIEQTLPAAEAVITQRQGNWVEFWLGGVDAFSLLACNRRASFILIDRNGQSLGQVQVESRQGLVGQGRVTPTGPTNGQAGHFLQEQIRGIPTQLMLKVGLDPSLEAEMAAAQTALQAYRRVQVVPLQQQEVHCILGRFSPKILSRATQDRSTQPSVGSLGLFSPGFEAIANSFGTSGETVEQAVKRLGSKLKALLANRLIRLLLNPHSSRLQVATALQQAGAQEQVLATAAPLRGSRIGQPSKVRTLPSSVARLSVGQNVQFSMTNHTAQTLYISVLSIDANQEITLIFPYHWKAVEAASRVEPDQTLLIPDPRENLFELQVQPPKGSAELLMIASSKPLRHALKGLQMVALRRGVTAAPLIVEDPLTVLFNLLSDLGEASTIRSGQKPLIQRDQSNEGAIVDSTDQAVNMAEIAVLSINVEII